MTSFTVGLPKSCRLTINRQRVSCTLKITDVAILIFWRCLVFKLALGLVELIKLCKQEVLLWKCRFLYRYPLLLNTNFHSGFNMQTKLSLIAACVLLACSASMGTAQTVTSVPTAADTTFFTADVDDDLSLIHI